jgi:predicted phosphodiesterase
MRTLILSDIHVEFHADAGRAFAASTPEADVLVLAGDIGTRSTLNKALEVFCSRYPKVLFVTGNHEYYQSSPKVMHAQIAEFAATHPNFHWLNNSHVTIDGVRFIGATLWFPNGNVVSRNREWLNDFAIIKDFVPWVFEENKLSQEYLAREVKPGDVVVTHHLPSNLSISPKYAGSPYNVFFLCNMERVIQTNHPAVWIHGHTHESADYRLADTRVVCNPFGYLRREMNPAFDEHKIIEIPTP